MSTKLATIPMSNIHKNPYRDFEMAQLREDTIASLMESINDTDFWQNYPVRIKDNTLVDGTIITSQAQIDALFDSEHDWSLEHFELPHGHHRDEALRRLEWSEVSLIVKHIPDELMLKMMANENKDGYGSNVGVLCETVYKVTLELNNQLDACKQFSDYQGELFKTKKAFEAAKTNGIGFRKVREYLGKTWSESDVRGASKILKLIDKGYFTQEDVGNVASMGLLETVGAIAEYAYEGKTDTDAPAYPLYWKREIINEVVDRCSPDKSGWNKITVSQCRRARTLFEKEGVNPAVFLKTGNTKAVFDPIKATKDLLFDPDKTEEQNFAVVDELTNRDGFTDFPELVALQDAIKKSMKASFARIAKGEEDVDEELEVVSEESLQDALDTGETGDVIVPDMFAGNLDELGEDGEGEIIPLPTNRIVDTYIQSASHLGHGTQMLLQDVESVGDHATLDTAVQDLLITTIKLANERLGRDTLVKLFKDHA